MKNKAPANNLKRFKSGMVLSANDLNNMYDTLSQIAKQANVKIRQKPRWESGSVLTAHSLNNFLGNVERVFDGLGLEKIKWSFGKFKDGTVLKAEYLNEILNKIQDCGKKAGVF